MSQPTFNPARTRLTRGLSEPGWVQPTFKKVEFFSTQPGSNPWWAGLAHGLKPILTSLPRTVPSQCWNGSYYCTWTPPMATCHSTYTDDLTHKSSADPPVTVWFSQTTHQFEDDMPSSFSAACLRHSAMIAKTWRWTSDPYLTQYSLAHHEV